MALVTSRMPYKEAAAQFQYQTSKAIQKNQEKPVEEE